MPEAQQVDDAETPRVQAARATSREQAVFDVRREALTEARTIVLDEVEAIARTNTSKVGSAEDQAKSYKRAYDAIFSLHYGRTLKKVYARELASRLARLKEAWPE